MNVLNVFNVNVAAMASLMNVENAYAYRKPSGEGRSSMHGVLRCELKSNEPMLNRSKEQFRPACVRNPLFPTPFKGVGLFRHRAKNEVKISSLHVSTFMSGNEQCTER